VEETATNAGGSGKATSEATAIVLPLAPTLLKAPAISGEARQGTTLTEHSGEWTHNPTGFTYQWLQCNAEGTLPCNPISGANKQEYVPGEGDVGHKLRVEDTATNTGGARKSNFETPAILQ